MMHNEFAVFYFILGLVLIGVAVMKSCVLGHNFIDRGKYIACDKCGLTYVKKHRNVK
jgi:hypothetical protein